MFFALLFYFLVSSTCVTVDHKNAMMFFLAFSLWLFAGFPF